MNIVLWIVQILLALAFLGAGTPKVFQYEKTKARSNDAATSISMPLGLPAYSLGKIVESVCGVWTR